MKSILQMDRLFQNPDLMGACLMYEGVEVDRRFLKKWMPTQYELFLSTVGDMAEGFSVVGRRMKEVVLVFGSFQMILIQENFYLLILIASPEVSISSLVSIGRGWLKEGREIDMGEVDEELVPPPPTAKPKEVNVEKWKFFRKELDGMLSKVLVSSQCQALIEKSCYEMGLSIELGIPEDRFEELGFRVIGLIPNRSKQESLRADLDELIQKRRML